MTRAGPSVAPVSVAARKAAAEPVSDAMENEGTDPPGPAAKDTGGVKTDAKIASASIIGRILYQKALALAPAYYLTGEFLV